MSIETGLSLFVVFCVVVGVVKLVGALVSSPEPVEPRRAVRDNRWQPNRNGGGEYQEPVCPSGLCIASRNVMPLTAGRGGMEYHNAYEAQARLDREAALSWTDTSQPYAAPDAARWPDAPAYARQDDRGSQGNHGNRGNELGEYIYGNQQEYSAPQGDRVTVLPNHHQALPEGEQQAPYYRSGDELGEFLYTWQNQQQSSDRVTVLPHQDRELPGGNDNQALPEGEREPDIIVVHGNRARQHAEKWH